MITRRFDLSLRFDRVQSELYWKTDVSMAAKRQTRENYRASERPLSTEVPDSRGTREYLK